MRGELGAGYTANEIFAEAQRVVRWHYHWLVIHEFLVKTVGNDMVDDVLSGGLEHFHWRHDPYIPVEFSVAAYRSGHSQVRPSYRGNFGTSATDPAQQFFAALRSRGRGPERPGRPPRRKASASPVHRLADLLRLR